MMMSHDEDDKKMKMAVIAHLMSKMHNEDFDKKFPGGKRPAMKMEKVEVKPMHKLTDMTNEHEEHEMDHVDTGSDDADHGDGMNDHGSGMPDDEEDEDCSKY